MFERDRWHVLELGADGRAVLGKRQQRVLVDVVGLQMTVGNSPGGTVRVGIEDPDPVAEFVRCGDEKAAKLAATEHAEGGRRQDHRKPPTRSGHAWA